jgi:hypothetical protein
VEGLIQARGIRLTEVRGRDAMGRIVRIVYLFKQDGAHSEICHLWFIELSLGGRSFIVIIARAGYAIQGGVNLNYQPAATYDAARPKFERYDQAVHLEESELPVPLSFHNGHAYLAPRPNHFPARPPGIVPLF